MPHENSLMHDLLKFIPWGRFDRLVEKHEADWRVRKLSSKRQLVALLDAQLSGASSLREVVATMASHEARLCHLGVAAPKRSTLGLRRPCEAWLTAVRLSSDGQGAWH